MRTDRELKQLATDIFEKKVFTSAQIHNGSDVPMVFMPIVLGCFSDMPDKEKEDVSLIYEYMDKSMPRVINGYPIFMSLQFLTREEHARMNTFYDAYKLIKDSFLKS